MRLTAIAMALISTSANAQNLPSVMPAPPANIGAAQATGISCARLAAATGDVNTFALCTRGQVILPSSQQALVQCAGLSTDISGFAGCAGAHILGKSLNGDQQAALECATRSKGDVNEFAGCLGGRFIGRQLTPDQRTALNCAQQSSGNMGAFATCAGTGILGPRLSQDQRAAIECAAQSGGDPTGFATCAGNRMINSKLNPEQQIAVQCVIETGGQPYAAATCTASRLTLRELQKCVADGIGGPGCFGDSNDVVGQGGWTARTFGNVLNDLRRGGPASTNDLFGGQGFAGQTLEHIRRNAPPPLEVGTVAGRRVCFPWC